MQVLSVKAARDAGNEGGSPKRKKSYLSRLSPSVMRVVLLRVSDVLLDGPRKKRDC